MVLHHLYLVFFLKGICNDPSVRETRKEHCFWATGAVESPNFNTRVVVDVILKNSLKTCLLQNLAWWKMGYTFLWDIDYFNIVLYVTPPLLRETSWVTDNKSLFRKSCCRGFNMFSKFQKVVHFVFCFVLFFSKILFFTQWMIGS